MALSEGEQRRLDEIERALATEDPKFAATITIDKYRRHRAIVAAAFFVIGMVGLVAGLVLTDGLLWAGVIVSIVGVGAMIAGALTFFRIRIRG
jgi:hypothetical protein